MIHKAGELVDHIIAAVEQHGVTPHTDLRVRVGSVGPIYRIAKLKGVDDERGRSLLIELAAAPESYG